MCPAGSRIATESECRVAVESFQIPQHTPVVINAIHDPKGCFSFNGLMYFNTHPDGKEREHRTPYCWQTSIPYDDKIMIPYDTMVASQSSIGHSVLGSADRPLTKHPMILWPGTCSHTKSEPAAWWKVWLGSTYRISSIKLTSRALCCPQVLQN